MDDLEYDIYDDLDVFKGNEKQQKEVNCILSGVLINFFWRLFSNAKHAFLLSVIYSIIYSFSV